MIRRIPTQLRCRPVFQQSHTEEQRSPAVRDELTQALRTRIDGRIWVLVHTSGARLQQKRKRRHVGTAVAALVLEKRRNRQDGMNSHLDYGSEEWLRAHVYEQGKESQDESQSPSDRFLSRAARVRTAVAWR